MSEGEVVHSNSTESDDAHSFRAFREHYLFNPWGLSPEYSKQQFLAIKHLDEKLSRFSWYQGLSVIGSTMFGYSRGDADSTEEQEHEPSDIDIIPIVDSRDPTFAHAATQKILKSFEQEVLDKFRVRVSYQNFVDVSHMHDATVQKGIQGSQVNMYALEALSHWTTQRGSEKSPGSVRVWIQEYKKLCDALSPPARETLKRNLVDRLAARDLHREYKIEHRVQEYKEASYVQKNVTKHARRVLWERRVHDLFGL